jgi:DNA-binding MarR family transcriptional regulator
MSSFDIWSLDLSLGFLLSKAARTMKRALDAKLANWNLTATQFIVLARLWEEDGISFSELSERLDFDNPTLTGIIDRMERDGLVARQRDGQDRRVVRVHVTPKGSKLREEIGLHGAAVDSAALHGLTPPQRRQMLESLQHVWRVLHD